MCINIYPKTSHQFVWYSIPFIQYSVYFRYSPKTNMVWTPFHIDLALQPHTLEKLNKYYFSYFAGPQKRGAHFLVRSPKNTGLTGRVHESCSDTSKCSAGMQQLHMLRLLVFPNLARHQQCVFTLVAWLTFLSSILVKTSGTPLTGRTWILGAIPVKVEQAQYIFCHQHQEPLKVDWDFTRLTISCNLLSFFRPLTSKFTIFSCFYQKHT